MLESLRSRFVNKLSRRELFRRGSLLALPALLPEKLVAAAAGTPKVRVGADISEGEYWSAIVSLRTASICKSQIRTLRLPNYCEI